MVEGDNGGLQGTESEAIQKGKEVVSASNEEVGKEVAGEINKNTMPPPHGSSRVTGGILRGRAVGNVLNLPDAPDFLDDVIPEVGTVKLYSDLSQHPSTHRPVLTMKTKMMSSLKPILEKLVNRYSPISSEYSIIISIIVFLMSLLEYRIYVHEDGHWSVKGEFKNALEEDEDVIWVRERDNKMMLSICAEGKDSLDVPSTSHVPGLGASFAPVSVAVGKGQLSKTELIAALNIPEQLTNYVKNPGLRLNYAKYKACLTAQDTLARKMKDGSWPEGAKKPTATEIVELFMSKSYWHKYITAAFHDISHYPLIKDWLEDLENVPLDEDVWGGVQTSYGFTDLMKEKERRQQQNKAKGKGKGKAKAGNNDNDNVAEGSKKKKKKKSSHMFSLFFRTMVTWIWMMMFTNIPLVAATANEQPFPSITFSVFNKFIEDNFISTVSLSTVLMLLFTVTENTDLLSLHFRQRSADHPTEKSTAATGWIRGLGAAVQRRLDEGNASLLKEFDMDAGGSEQKEAITLGLKIDALAKVLGLCPINKSGKFKGKLKPVSHKQVQPIHTLCPNTATCHTVSCERRALYQGTKPRDVPLVRLIKNYTVYDNSPLYSGRCNECNTIYYADHERSQVPHDNGKHERVYLSTAKYIKVGQTLWVDRAFSTAVLDGIYTFHASAAAYTEFWNNCFDKDGKGRVSRRQVWQAFVQESIRMVASASNTHLTIVDGLGINEVTKEAYKVLGENGFIKSADNHACAECTHKHKRTADIIADADINEADMVGMEDNAAPVKMVVIDGIVMGHSYCAYQGCESDLANARGGVYCALHELLHGGKCHAANCDNPNVEGTLACEQHQGKWRKHLMNNKKQVLGGYRRALRRPDDSFSLIPAVQNQVQPHDEEEQETRSRSKDCFIPPKMYCVETICAPCGVVVAWAKFVKAESPTNILGFLKSVYPKKDERPAYICIDKACMVLRTCVANSDWTDWLDTSRFIVDAYHYINHRATDNLCRTYCNPAPLNGSAPNLVIAEHNAKGELYYKRAFNNQACEQLNAWLGGFESILKRMTPGNFDWFLHTMLFYHTRQVLKKQSRRRESEDESEDDENDEAL
ncbi:hypothetical protein JOM56_013401 [Amanita muscaria]